MKPIRFIILPSFIVMFFCVQAMSQDVRMQKTFWGVRFYKGNQELQLDDVHALMKPDEAGYQKFKSEFKKAKVTNGLAQVFGVTGGVLIGWPLGTALAGGDPQWGLAAGGAGLILLAIPLSISSTKHGVKAVSVYHSDQGSTHGVSLDLIPYGTGAKLVLRF